MNSFRYRHRGIALVYAIFVMFSLLLLIGVALDTARVYYANHQLQVAADGAALAALESLPSSPATGRTKAVAVLKANYADARTITVSNNPSNSSGAEIVTGFYNRSKGTFTWVADSSGSTTSINACRVNLSDTSLGGPVGLIFGKMIGIQSASLGRGAIAMIGGGNGIGLLLLNNSAAGSLSLTGNATLNVPKATIQVNSSNNNAAKATGNSYAITASALNVTGNTSISRSNLTVNTNQPTIADPIAGYYPVPNSSNYGTASPDTSYHNGTYYYPKGLNLTGTTTVKPGIYYIGGNPSATIGLTLSGNITANNVMFYVTGTKPISIPSGNSSITISPPDPSVSNDFGADTYQGIAIWRDNTNAAVETLNLSGTPNLSVSGMVYLPKTAINASGDVGSVGTQMVADSLAYAGGGNGSFDINYDASKAIGRARMLVK